MVINTFDAIVVGTGHSGGWAVKEFCEKGLKTLVLERRRNIEHIKEHITFIWHPWSLGRFDKEMKMLDFTFSYIKKVGLKTSTVESFYKILKNK